jgi:hypothetical protein
MLISFFFIFIYLFLFEIRVEAIRNALHDELIIQQADDVDIKPNTGSYYNDGKNLFIILFIFFLFLLQGL